MTETITKAMKRPGVVPAFLTALGVFVTVLVTDFLQTVFSTLSAIAGASISADYVGTLWFGLFLNSVTGPLPFALGVFLCLWQVAPIAPGLRLAHVVTRSVLAALLGGVLAWLVFWISQLVVDVLPFAREFQGSIVFGKLEPDAVQALFRALALTVGYLPIVVLAGILLWGWLQRHPLGTRVHGALDEV
jgi:hypothetical protein